MTPEQLEELKKMLAETKTAIEETEAMVTDLGNCSSEISKKYLSAAIKKQAATITSHMKTIE